MKCLCVILDGLGDLPSESLKGLTPLQAANKPCIDELARSGMTGLMDVYAPGVPIGTDVGHICLFGYDPHEVYSGRGPIEAIGAGLILKPGDIAFRGNFATIDTTGMLIDKRAGRINKNVCDLISSISKIKLINDVGFKIAQATEHRFAVVFNGIDKFAHIIDAYPSHNTKLPCDFPWSKPYDNSTNSCYISEVINDFINKSSKILNNHELNKRRMANGLLPANTILLRGGGQYKFMEPFSSKFNGVIAGLVAAEDTVIGLAKMLSLITVKLPGMTGGYDTCFQIKANATIELLKKVDLAFLHIKATDLAGHDRLPLKKKELIENIDGMLQYIFDNVDRSKLIISIVADHSTPCSIGEHSGDPVPILLYGPNLRKDSTKKYDEITGMNGGLGHIRGQDLIKIVLSSANLVEKYGC